MHAHLIVMAIFEKFYILKILAQNLKFKLNFKAISFIFKLLSLVNLNFLLMLNHLINLKYYIQSNLNTSTIIGSIFSIIIYLPHYNNILTAL